MGAGGAKGKAPLSSILGGGAGVRNALLAEGRAAAAAGGGRALRGFGGAGGGFGADAAGRRRADRLAGHVRRLDGEAGGAAIATFRRAAAAGPLVEIIVV